MASSTFSGPVTSTNGFVGAVTGNITGNITGNVTGNVTGDVTGNVTGDVTGNLTGNVTGNVTGNLTGNVTGDVVGQVTGPVEFEAVTTTNVIAAAESGTTYFLNAAAGFVSTLPAPAAGLTFTFIVKAAPSGGSYTVVTNASANIIKGQAYVCADAAGDAGTADDTITFVDGQSVAGDRVVVISDGTSWFAYAFCAVAAGVTFTQAS